MRFMVPSENCDYGKLAAHALKTVMEGSKGRAVERVAEDVATVRRLRSTAPALNNKYKERLTAECGEVAAACRRRVQEGRRGAAKPKPKLPPQPVAPVLPVPTADAGSVVEPSVEEAVMEEAQDVPLVGPLDRGQSGESLAASSSNAVSDGDGCEADDTVSEEDSRDGETDDSWDETSAAPTDPFGFSPGRQSDEEDHSDQDDRSPSAACTDGED